MPEIDQALILEAARRLAQGRLVAFPTETVYGLGADAENPAAIARIYAAKNRPAHHPVIVHLSPDTDPAYWAADVPPVARQLMAAFWPGPLTLILRRAAHIDPAVSGGQDSIGLRCPSHPVAQTLLHAFARLKSHGHGGVAAPSANRFGHVSPTRAAHVRAEFTGLDDQALMILEGGPSTVGIESTILDLSRLDQGVAPSLLRPGHVGAAELAEVIGAMPAMADAAAPRVSGSLKAHYATRTPLALIDQGGLQRLSQGLFELPQALCASKSPGGAALRGQAVSDSRGGSDNSAASGKIAAIVLEDAPRATPAWVQWHVMPADPVAYARDLYALLRRLDAAGLDLILLQQPPASLAWQGVNDRIARAAAAFELNLGQG